MARRQCLKASELQEIIDGWSDTEEESTPLCVVYIPPEKVDEISDEEFIDDNEMPPDQNIETFAEIPGTFEIEYASGTDSNIEPDALQKVKKRKTASTSRGKATDSNIEPDASQKSKRSRGEAKLNSSLYTPLKDFGIPAWRKPVDVKYSREAEAEVPDAKIEEIIDKIGML